MKSAPVTQEGGGRGRPVGVETLLRFPGRRNELIAHFPRSDESVEPAELLDQLLF